MALQRGIKTEELCRIRRYKGIFTFADLMEAVPGILPTDRIYVDTQESYHSDNYSQEGHTDLIATRQRQYTDEEQVEYEQMWEDIRNKGRFERYEQFLKLKGEFDGQPAPDEPEWDQEEERERNYRKGRR